MELIALSGYARSGKDAAAKVLVEEFGFTRVAFADKLREFLYALNPIVLGWAKNPVSGKMDYAPGVWNVQSVIDRYGWDGYKESPFGPEIRRLLQRLGTEAGRNTLWDSIWIDAAFANVPEDAKICITDCRFSNEAEAIKSRGGKIWRVLRDGIGPAVGSDGSIHPSETSLDDWTFDKYIHNDGTLEDYRKSVIRRYLEGEI